MVIQVHWIILKTVTGLSRSKQNEIKDLKLTKSSIGSLDDVDPMILEC